MQDLFVSELSVTVGRGLRDELGLELQVPFRLVRDRVEYLDLARHHYQPTNPGLHHRNETIARLADPQLALAVGRRWDPWTFAGRVGLSIPLGRTEANPFELGHQGLEHQHIQFGTGTWDPTLGVAVGHSAGPLNLRLSGVSRLTLSDNDHGYRAGNRCSAQLAVAPKLGDSWSADAGLMLAREEPEKWGGRTEDEGNLGRTDLFLSLGAGRAIPPIGGLAFSLLIPLASQTTGEQVDIPIVFSLLWGR